MLNIFAATICFIAAGLSAFAARIAESKRDRIIHSIWAVLLFGMTIVNLSMA